ncbi:unnamed protein product [Closterium sp. Yama58-4]|nr:unnamed protein product [Closterium sp. Yama58-4]
MLPFVALTHDISASVASILLSPSSRSIHPHLFQAWNFTPSPRAPSPPPSAHPEQPLDYGCFFSTPPISLAPPALPVIPGIAYTSTAAKTAASPNTCISALPAPPSATDLAQSKKDQQPLRAEGNCWEADGYGRLGQQQQQQQQQEQQQQEEVLTQVVKQPLQRSLSPSRERRKSVLRGSGDGGSPSARPFSGATESSGHSKLHAPGVTVSGLRHSPSRGELRTADAGSFMEQLASFFTSRTKRGVAVAPDVPACDRAASRAPKCAAKPPRPPSSQSLLPAPATRSSANPWLRGHFGRKGHDRRQSKSSRSRRGVCGGSKSGQAGEGAEGVMLPMLVLLVGLFFVLTFVQHIFSPEQSALFAADEARARSGSGYSVQPWDTRGNGSSRSNSGGLETESQAGTSRSPNGGSSASEARTSTVVAGAAGAPRSGQNRKLGRAPVAAPDAASGIKTEGAGVQGRDGEVSGAVEDERGTVSLGELGSIEAEGMEERGAAAGLAGMARPWGLSVWQMRRR